MSELSVSDRNYVRGLIVERSFYVTRGEADRVAAVDVELRRLGVDPAHVETPGAGRADKLDPRVETRGKGSARGRD